MKTSAHAWQNEIVKEFFEQLTICVEKSIGSYENLIINSYAQLKQSVEMQQLPMPSLDEVLNKFNEVIKEEQFKTNVVNKEIEVESLTNDDGELALDVPFTIFIGGQILDRGITISNLLGFYYGRNPKSSQQDTTLQHARMYGYRNKDDLAVTRIYTAQIIYEKMKRIYEFDSALRESLSNDQDSSVVFLTRDLSNKVRPCSPNKIKLSNITTLKAYKRNLPIGFQAAQKYPIRPFIAEIDEMLTQLFNDNFDRPILVDTHKAISIMDKISKTLKFEIDEGYNFNWKETNELMSYLANLHEGENKGKVWVSVAHDRNIARHPKETIATRKYSDSPDTPSERKVAREYALNNPILFLLKQNGLKEQGWKGNAFYWPILIAQKNMTPVIYAPENNL